MNAFAQQQQALGTFWGHPIDNGFHHEHERYNAVALSTAPGELQMKHNPTVMSLGADVKPRLSKEQHEVLEEHFRREHKPSTQTKKEIAERLGTSLEKINNWFQNRRAKVKQDLKKQENNSRNLLSVLPNSQINAAPADTIQESHLDGSESLQFGQHAISDPDSEASSSSMPYTSDFGGLEYIPETTQPGSSQAIMDSLTQAGYQMPDMSNQLDLNGYSIQPSFEGMNAQSVNFHLAHSEPVFQNVPTSSGDLFNPFASSEIPSIPSQGSSEDTPRAMSHGQMNTQLDTNMTGTSMQDSTSLSATFTDWTPDQESAVSIQFPSGFDDDLSRSPSELERVHSTPNVTSNVWPSQVQMNSLYPGRIYQQGNHSTPVLSGQRNDLLGNQQDATLSMDVSRRTSSTAGITETLRDTTIQQSNPNESNFKQPPRTGLGDRRPRRPANLNVPRSSSYSYGMSGPGSPSLSANQNDASIRRIRSSMLGGTATGRIHKGNNTVPAQRSPNNLTFADAAKLNRSYVTSGPATPGTLGPQTPLSANDWNQTQPWLHGMVPSTETDALNSSPDSYNAASMPFSVSSATSSVFPAGAGTATSPPTTPLPTTPLEAGEVAKHRAYMSLRAQLYRDTPPQSAPATQQTFGPAAFPLPPSSQPMQFSDSQDIHTTAGLTRNGSIRRPSLPDASVMSSLGNGSQAPEMPMNANAMAVNPNMWEQPIHMFNDSGALQTAFPHPDGKLEFVGMPSSQYAAQQMEAQSQQQFAAQQMPHLNPQNTPSPGSSHHSPHSLSQQATPQPHQHTLQSCFSASSSNSSGVSPPQPQQQPHGLANPGLEVHQYRPKDDNYVGQAAIMAERQQVPAQPQPQQPKVFQFISEGPATYAGK